MGQAAANGLQGAAFAMKAKLVNLEDARINLSELFVRVRYLRERFVVIKRGRPIALVTPWGEGLPRPESLPDYFAANLKVLDDVEIAD